jgi:hypothetical protein
MSAPDERVYPLPLAQDDERFSFGLLADVIRVLEDHGYPPVRQALDLVALQQQLHEFLYRGDR